MLILLEFSIIFSIFYFPDPPAHSTSYLFFPVAPLSWVPSYAAYTIHTPYSFQL